MNTQVAIPYIRAKLKDLYQRLGGGIDSDILAARGEDGGDYRGSVSAHVSHFSAEDKDRVLSCYCLRSI